MLENDGNQNPEEFYTNKYEKHIVCSYGCKLACVDYKFSKPFKTYLGADTVYNFINIMIEENKYCSEVMKKRFEKELVMNKEDNESFKNSAKCWMCCSDYVDIDFKVTDYCHITRKYRGSTHRVCNIDINLNHEITVVLHNLEKT